MDNIEVDTHHFKGNFPESILIEGLYYHGTDLSELEDRISREGDSLKWTTLLERTKLSAHKQHYFSVSDGAVRRECGAINIVRVSIFPDGGVSRIRLNGLRSASGTPKL